MTRDEFLQKWNTCAENNYKGRGREIFGWWVMQDEREFWPLLEEVAKTNPARILEIGSSHGGSLVFFDMLLSPGGQLVSLNFDKKTQVKMDFSNSTSQVTCLNMNSHLQETLDTVTDILDGPLDFLFIDGDHSYEGAKADYEMYSPLVRPGGLIGFHDISYDSDIQVGRVFDEIDAPKRKIELTHGIGMVFK